MTKRRQLRYPFHVLNVVNVLADIAQVKLERDALSGFCKMAKASGLWSVNTVNGLPSKEYRKNSVTRNSAKSSQS